MKKILTICLIMLLLCGCSPKPQSYPFVNKSEPIESVELLYYPRANNVDEEWMAFQQIRVLEPEEITTFMNALYALPTKRARPTPPSDYGSYVARVTYENGDMEYFGSVHIEFVANGTDAHAMGYYYFPGNAFEELFFGYAGEWQNAMRE